MIYKPETKKDFYLPAKRQSASNTIKDGGKVNDSFNASKIVSSLVEANKNKLISNGGKGKKEGNFEKVD